MVHGVGGQHGDRRAARTCGRRPRSGRDFDLSPSSLTPLEPYRDYLTIVSNTDVRNAEAFTPPEIGGDHFRSSAVFLTQAHPKQTQGSDVHAGTSLDQIYAKTFGQDTAIPSMQLCIESVDQAGGCAYGYSCAYTDSISWAIADAAAADDPRSARGVRSAVRRRRDAGSSARRTGEAIESLLDWVTGEVDELKRSLGPADRARLDDYLDDVREIERRIQTGRSAQRERRAARRCPKRRSACPTRSTSTSS